MSKLKYFLFFFIIFNTSSFLYAQSLLPEPEPKLKPRINFWIQVYTEIGDDEGFIHDSKYPWIIYEKINFKDIKNNPKAIQAKITHIKNFYSKLLLSIHNSLKDNKELNPTQKRIFKLFDTIQESKKFYYASLENRVRFQQGQKDKFKLGLFYSGRYLPTIEQIFKNEGLPIELSRLPFVESSFNVKAKSKVGASGIWQFMRSTGKLYLRIDDAIDERNDPITSSRAAAKLLKENYQVLKSWPLAITAYNHGRRGLLRAVNQLNTNSLSEMIENFRSRSFGFASSNFYAEFMAAVEVEKNAKQYFPNFERDKPIDFFEVQLLTPISFKKLVEISSIPEKILIDYNPSFTDKLVKGKFLIPKNFFLKIPSAYKESFLNAYSKFLPNNFKKKF